MKGQSDWLWVVILLLFVLVEPLRDAVWVSLMFTDPFMLIVLLLVVWYVSK